MDTERTITHRQMRAVEFWVRSGFKSKAKALLAAGYSKSIAQHPEKVFGSAVVRNELARRGYDQYGLRHEMEAVMRYEPTPPPVPEVVLPALTREQLQDLKEKLAATPDLPVRYASFPS